MSRCDELDDSFTDRISLNKFLNCKPKVGRSLAQRKKKCSTGVQCRIPHLSRQTRFKARSKLSSLSITQIGLVEPIAGRYDKQFQDAPQRVPSGEARLSTNSLLQNNGNENRTRPFNGGYTSSDCSCEWDCDKVIYPKQSNVYIAHENDNKIQALSRSSPDSHRETVDESNTRVSSRTRQQKGNEKYVDISHSSHEEGKRRNSSPKSQENGNRRGLSKNQVESKRGNSSARGQVIGNKQNGMSEDECNEIVRRRNQGRGTESRRNQQNGKGNDTKIKDRRMQKGCARFLCPKAIGKSDHFCYCNAEENMDMQGNPQPDEVCQCEYFETDEPSGKQNASKEEIIGIARPQSSVPESMSSSRQLIGQDSEHSSREGETQNRKAQLGTMSSSRQSRPQTQTKSTRSSSSHAATGTLREVRDSTSRNKNKNTEVGNRKKKSIGGDLNSSAKVDVNRCMKVPCPKDGRKADQGSFKTNEMHYCYCKAIKSGTQEPSEGCHCANFDSDEPGGEQNANVNERMIEEERSRTNRSGVATAPSSDPEAMSSSRHLTAMSSSQSRPLDGSQKSAQRLRDGTQNPKSSAFAASTSKSTSKQSGQLASARSSPKQSRPGAMSSSRQLGADSPKQESISVPKRNAARTDQSTTQTSNKSVPISNATPNSVQFTSHQYEVCDPSNQPWCMFGNPQWSNNCQYHGCSNREQTWRSCNGHRICNCYCQCCLRALNNQNSIHPNSAATWVEEGAEGEQLKGPLGSSPGSSLRSAANTVRSLDSKTDSKLYSPQGSGLVSDSKTYQVPGKTSSRFPDKSAAKLVDKKLARSAEECHSICPNCGININEFIRNSKNKNKGYPPITVEEDKNIYQSPLQMNLSKQQGNGKSYENNDRKKESSTKPHCNCATCTRECKRCKILPAEGKKGEPLVNLVVSDKCNIQQLIEILNETSAKLEEQQNLVNQSVGKTATAEPVFNFDGNIANNNWTSSNPNNIDKHQMMGNHNTQSNRRQDNLNVNYNSPPPNAYPQYDPRLSQTYEAPNAGTFPNSVRILTQTEYDYPDPAAGAYQPNASYRGECTCYPTLNNYIRRCSGSTFPNCTGDSAQTSPVGKQAVLQKNLNSKSFLELLDLTMAVKEKGALQKDKVFQPMQNMQISNEEERTLKVSDYTVHTNTNGEQSDRVYKDINPTQPPFYLNEVFNNPSIEKFKGKPEYENRKNVDKFECNFYKIDDRGNRSCQRKRFSDIEHPGHPRRKAEALHQSQEKALRKKLLRKQFELEQNTSDSDYFRAASYTPEIRIYDLRERDIRERKRSGFDQMKLSESSPKSYGFDSCRRVSTSSEMKLMEREALYNDKEIQSETSYIDSHYRRRLPRKADSLRYRQKSYSRFQNLAARRSKYRYLLRRREKDKNETSNLYMRSETRSKMLLSRNKMKANAIGESPKKSNSRSSFPFRNSQRIINKVVPLAKELNESKKNFTMRSKVEKKENTYFDYSDYSQLDHAESKNSKSKNQHLPIRRMTEEMRVNERPTYVESRSRVFPNKLLESIKERNSIKGESERSDASVLRKMESRNRLNPFRNKIEERKSDHSEYKSFEAKRRLFANEGQIKVKTYKSVIGNLNSNKSVTSFSHKSEKKAKDESLDLKAMSFQPNSVISKTKRDKCELPEIKAVKDRLESIHKSRFSAPLRQEKVLKKCAPIPPPKPVKKGASRPSDAVSASNHKQHRAVRSLQQNQSDGDDIKVLYDSSSKFSRHSCGDGDTNTDCEPDTKPRTSQNNFFSMLLTRDKLTDSKRYS